MNDNLITDLAKHGDVLHNNPETLFLLRQASEVINVLAEYLLMRENLAVALNNPNLWKSPEKLDKIVNECREITFRVSALVLLFTFNNDSA